MIILRGSHKACDIWAIESTDSNGYPIVILKLTSYKSKNWMINNIPDSEGNINSFIAMRPDDFCDFLKDLAGTDMDILIDKESSHA